MKNTLQITAITLLLGSTTSIYASGAHDTGGQGHDEHKMEKKMQHGHGEEHNMGMMGHDMSKMGAHWTPPKDAVIKLNPIKSNAESIATGRAIYQKNCVSCHGVNAMGDGPTGAYLNPKPANLVAMSGMHPDGDFAWKIENGRGAMPGWKSILSESDTWHTVNFIQSLKDRHNKPSEDGHHSNHGNDEHHS